MTAKSKKFTKFTATGATAALVASALVPSAAADEVSTAAFTDVASQYEEAVNYVVENNLSQGLTATRYGVSETIKRGDAAIILAQALGLQNPEAPASGFTDVPDRAVLAINSLKDAGVVAGKSATRFGFNDTLTRGEVALLLARANSYNLTGDVGDVAFTDVNDRYIQAVAGLVENGITQGKSATQFGTNDEILRGEFAIFIYRAETLEDEGEVDAGTTEAINAVNAAANQLELAEALEADYFENVDLDLIPFYFEELAEVEFKSIEAIQSAIDTVNADTDREEREAAAVEAVNEATTQIQLDAALENALFERYNSDWISQYEDALESADADTDSVEAIQDILDTVNETEVAAALGLALEGLDAEDIDEARELVEAYIIADDEESELTPKQDMLDALAVQSALVAINDADSNAELTSAFADLEETTDDFEADTVNSAELSAYRQAIAGEGFTDIQAVNDAIETVNETAETYAVDAINDITEDTTTTELNELLAVLADRSSFVAGAFVLDTVNEAYLAKYLEELLAAGELETAAEVMQIIEDVNEPTEELAAVASADAVGLYEALSAVQFNFSNLLEENEEAYAQDIEAFNFYANAESGGSVANVRNLITAVNAKEAVEGAETATEVRDALVQASLASIELGAGDFGGTEYINLGSLGRLEVAGLMLADDEEYATVQELQESLAAAIDERESLIANVNSAGTITAVDAAIEALGNSNYDALSGAEQLEIAENVLDRRPEEGFDSITQIVSAF